MIGSMTNADGRIAAIATGQLGTFTRAQATDAGLSDRQLRSRVQSGFLDRTGPNTFRVAGAPNSNASRLRSLLMDIGGDVWCSGPTAAALHGFDGWVLRPPFHLLIPAKRNVRRNGAVIHRSASIDRIDRCEVDDLRVTSGVRTLIDLARTASADELHRALDSVFLLGLTNEDHLFRRIASLRSSGRYGVPALIHVLERRALTGGTESWLEREYLRLLGAAQLPTPLSQQVLGRAGDHLIRVDCRFPGTNLVIELLGYRYHRSRGQMNHDAARVNALMTDGYTPYQFTYDQLADDPASVVATTINALARALRTA